MSGPDSYPSSRSCTCKPWEQRWFAETPHLCNRCGGLFDPKTVPARAGPVVFVCDDPEGEWIADMEDEQR